MSKQVDAVWNLRDGGVDHVGDLIMRTGRLLRVLIAGVPLAMLHPHQSEARSYKIIYSFGEAPDGNGPLALIPYNGALYGVTHVGGANKRGTIFSVTPSGKETIIHSFGSIEDDGLNPVSLVALGGDLFGITGGGGSHKDGTVFRVTNGKYVVLHSFSGGADGANPAALAVFKGAVYGVTLLSGTNGNGTLYQISRKGDKTVLYNFGNGGVGDPILLVANGEAMFGATMFGGPNGGGTVFTASAAGEVNIIHSFDPDNPNDGFNASGLVAVGNTLYCLTMGGGKNSGGAFLSFAPDGSESLLYSFGTAPIGGSPQHGMTQVGALFYGATQNSEETLFSLTEKGKPSVVVTFPYTESVPTSGWGGVVDLGGTLYGITYQGGNSRPPGRGTVYSVGP